MIIKLTSAKKLEVDVNMGDPADRIRKDVLRGLGLYRFNSSTKKWDAKFSPEALLETYEMFQANLEPADDYTRGALDKCLEADQKRKDRLALLGKMKVEKTVDLEGFRFLVPPYQHQKEALSFLKVSDVCALFADCGIGKTYIVLHWLQYLKDHRVPGLKALIVAPLRTLYSAWAEDAKKFTPGLRVVTFNDDVETARGILAGTGEHDLYLINPDKVRILEEALATFQFDALIIDESSKIKNFKAKTTKSIIRLADSGPKFRVVMSGTPAPNSPVEYWPQLRVLSKRLLGSNFYAFRNQFFVPEGFGGFTFRLNPLLQGEFLSRVHAFSLRYRSEDCLDLPERIDHTMQVILPPPVMNLYKAYKKKAIATLQLPSQETEVWASHHELDKLLKLREICNGYLFKRVEGLSPEGEIEKDEIFRFLHEEKLLAVESLLEEFGNEQVLIWAHFRPEFELLSKRLPTAKIVNGTISGPKAEEAIEEFKTGKLQYLLAHPRSIAHGLTFTTCRYIIWYSMDWSAEYDYQANKRIHRAGQIRTTHHYYLLATSLAGEETIDGTLLHSLRGKYSTQAELLNAFVKS